MRKAIYVFLFLTISNFIFLGFVYCENSIELDLVNQRLKFNDFNVKGNLLNADFSFTIVKEAGSLKYGLEGKDIIFGNRMISSVKAKLEKSANLILIDYIKMPQFEIKGDFNIENLEVNLNIDASWIEKAGFLKGQVKAHVKTWGFIDNASVSGYFVVEEGIYRGREFRSFRVDFFGKPPVLNVTDSEVILHDGTTLGVEGKLDLRDFSNIMPGAEYNLEKMYIDRWQVSSESGEDITLKKNVDEKIDVYLRSPAKEGVHSGPLTELRYNIKDDKYLRFKMDEEETTLRLEKRRDF